MGQLTLLNSKLFKKKTVNCSVGTTTFQASLASLGLSGRDIIMCQCCNSMASVCKIIGFSVVGSMLYISIDGGVLVGTASINILYI